MNNIFYIRYIYNPIFTYYHENFRTDIKDSKNIYPVKWDHSLIKMVKVILKRKLIGV